MRMMECSRCLKKYTSEINAPIIVMYHLVAGELKAEGASARSGKMN